MNYIPIWKLKREFWRVLRSLVSFANLILELIYFRIWYDLFTSKKIKLNNGVLDFTDEVAIFLIYPKIGVLPSHIHMLDELHKNGITPIVVSNLPLSKDDLECLKARCAYVMQRQNIGYDFGGYRDGILSIEKNINNFNRLWILNDSAWYIPRDSGWFDVVRKKNHDFVGASSTLTRGKISSFMNVQSYWPYRKDHKLFHYGSFALSFGANILRDPDFLKFWRKLNITNDKRLTVLRGEIGLTQWVVRRGFSHSSTSDLDDLDVVLSELPVEELRLMARNVMLLDDGNLEKLRNNILNDRKEGNDERDLLSAFILFSVAKMGFVYAVADYAMSARGLQFLKKSPMRLNSNSYDRILKIVADIPGPVGVSIRDEVKMLGRCRKS